MPVGYEQIVPTSATAFSAATVSIGENGLVTFGDLQQFGGNEIRIDGIFSATYTNYVAVVQGRAGSGTPDIFFRLTAGGVADSSSNYRRFFSAVKSDSTEATGINTSETQFRLSTSGGGFGKFININGPAVANATAFTSQGTFADGSITWLETGYTEHNVSTAYDGLLISGNSLNAIFGTIRFYGIVE